MSEPKAIKRLYKPTEAAFYLGISTDKLKQLTDKKLLKRCFDGQMYFYTIEELEGYVKRLFDNEKVLGAKQWLQKK